MTYIELLAPARNLECGMAAVDHGADAVYIGAQRFGARAAAGNSVEDIAALCRYAHRFAVKVYVTVNTILYDDELQATERLLWQLYDAGADAFIVQDLAMLKMRLPPVPLHASTQMDNRSPEQVSWLADMGYSQVVLARECSLEQIARIHQAVPHVPLEAFVHGALCVSYSGCCQASQYCFSRSANRGQCAQFCRLPFTLEDAEGNVLAKEKYLLSLRDMNRTSSLEEMMDAGIRSFKIEGRLKDVSYVKNVTAWYRLCIDKILRRRPEYARPSYGKVELNFQPDPNRSFSRGFTSYFIHDRREKMASVHTPKSMGQLVGTVKDVRKGNCVVVSGVASFANGDGLCYLDADGKLRGFRVNRVEGNHLFLADPVEIHPGTPLYRSFDQGWERMMSKPTAARMISLDWHLKDVEDGFLLSVKREDGLTLERVFQWEHQQAKSDQMDNIRQLLSKLGETHYTSRSVEVNFSQPWFVPRSQLSAWRRDIIELLDSKDPERISQAHEMCIMSPKDKVKAFNVSNRLAAQAYEEAGLTHWKPAMEADSPNGSPVLMECRYCLRYELGLCPKKQQAKVSYKLPLYLKSQDGRKFALQFDCAHCKMYVLNEDSK